MFVTLLRSALAGVLIATGAPVLSDETETAAEARLGPLVLVQGFSRATRPGAPVAGGFVTIENTGDTDDRLVAASSAVAGHMEVHEMAMVDGVMQMRELAGGLPIPAGETVLLMPGGYHVMLMELKAPLVEGETVDVTLTFETAGEVTIPLKVLAPDAEEFEGH
jgi:copper(I)-binding protein